MFCNSRRLIRSSSTATSSRCRGRVRPDKMTRPCRSTPSGPFARTARKERMCACRCLRDQRHLHSSSTPTGLSRIRARGKRWPSNAAKIRLQSALLGSSESSPRRGPCSRVRSPGPLAARSKTRLRGFPSALSLCARPLRRRSRISRRGRIERTGTGPNCQRRLSSACEGRAGSNSATNPRRCRRSARAKRMTRGLRRGDQVKGLVKKG
jgi:hypothetical protein